MLTTVAIPVRDGAPFLERLLDAVARQRHEGDLEVVVCDSGSRDGSVDVARTYGADVVEIAPGCFGHGRTRNLLMERSHGEHVAFLTQDSIPDGDDWLSRLLGGFALADGVGLTFGPYHARPEASPMVARELAQWFGQISSSGQPRMDRLEPAEREISALELLGPRGFFTDANGCVARAAWEEVRFRDVPYAEDHLLAHDLMRAGWAKVFVPDAPVVHSHEYSIWGWLRRSFDEAKAVKDIYGWKEPLSAKVTTLNVYGRVGADWRWAGGGNLGATASTAVLTRSAAHHLARMSGSLLGSRYERLPAPLAARLSLEGRYG